MKLNVRRASPIALLLLAAPTCVSAATVILRNGDSLQGTITAQTAKQITLKHAVLGVITVPRTQISALHDVDPAAAADVRAKSSPPPKTDAAAQVAKTDPDASWMTDWKRHFSLGLAGANGKNDNRNLNLGFDANFEDPHTRWTIKSAYDHSETDSITSEQSFFASANRDWLMPDSPWFGFASGRLDWDRLKDWDYRLAANAGAGYQFVTNDEWRLLGRAGLGGNQTFGGTRAEFSPESLFGMELGWKVSPKQSLSFSNTLYPDLSQGGEFRNLSQFDWRLKLDQDKGVALKFSLTNEYDSQATGSIGKNDFNYAASLDWEL